VRGIVDISIGFDLGFIAQKAQIPIRNRVFVKPCDRIGDSHSVAPVCIEAMGDEPNPNTSVGKTPEGFCRTRYDRHFPEHAVLNHRQTVESLELGSVHLPLSEVPSFLRRQRGQINSSFLGNHPSKGFGVITAYSVEINSENELRHCQ
jgi:hypothetical protein